MATDETNDRKRSLGTILIAGIVFLALVYVPVVGGPVLWLDEHGYLPTQARILYDPLDELAIRSELASTVIEWYAELWVGPPPQ